MNEKLQSETTETPMTPQEVDWSKITRLEVIGPHGREFTRWHMTKAEPSVQDQGRTLKIFFDAALPLSGVRGPQEW